MSAYKDKTGTWRYRCTVTLRDGTTERISGTPSAANTKLAALEAEASHRERTVNPPTIVAPKKAAPGFAAFSKTWLDAYPASAENRTSTIKEKEFHVRAHLVPYWNDTPIDQIDAMGIATMITELKKKKKLLRSAGGELKESTRTISPKTIKNVTQTLHKMLTSAHEWGLLGKVPKFPKRKKVDAPWDWYTAEESAALLAATHAPRPFGSGRGRPESNREEGEDHALLLFALKTGARVGEQSAISWNDIDWRGMKIHFRRQYHKGEFRELKAGPSRAVDMSEALAAALKKWRATQVRALGVSSGNAAIPDGRDLIFPLDHTGTPRETWHFRDILDRYARRAGLRRIKWHELRHSFASQLVSAGVPLKQVQEWLGHSTIHMTMRYAHLAPTSGAGFIAVLDRVPTPERPRLEAVEEPEGKT